MTVSNHVQGWWLTLAAMTSLLVATSSPTAQDAPVVRHVVQVGDSAIVAFHPETGRVVTQDYRRLGLWDSSTGVRLARVRARAATPDAGEIDPTGRYFVSGRLIWDLETNTVRDLGDCEANPPFRYRFMDGGRVVIHGSERHNMDVCIVELATGQTQSTAAESWVDWNAAKTFGFLPTTNQLLSETGDLTTTALPDAASRGSVEGVTADGKYVLTKKQRRSYEVLSLHSGKVVNRFELGESHRAYGLAGRRLFYIDLDTYALAGRDIVHDTTHTVPEANPGTGYAWTRHGVTRDGRHVWSVSGSEDRKSCRIQIVHPESLELVGRFVIDFVAEPSWMQVLPGGVLAMVTWPTQKLRLFRLDDGEALLDKPLVVSREARVRWHRAATPGPVLEVRNDKGGIELWRRDGTALELPGLVASVRDIDAVGNEHVLVEYETKAVVWHPQSGRIVSQLSLPEKARMRLSHDRQFLSVGSRDEGTETQTYRLPELELVPRDGDDRIVGTSWKLVEDGYFVRVGKKPGARLFDAAGRWTWTSNGLVTDDGRVLEPFAPFSAAHVGVSKQGRFLTVGTKSSVVIFDVEQQRRLVFAGDLVGARLEGVVSLNRQGNEAVLSLDDKRWRLELTTSPPRVTFLGDGLADAYTVPGFVVTCASTTKNKPGPITITKDGLIRRMRGFCASGWNRTLVVSRQGVFAVMDDGLAKLAGSPRRFAEVVIVAQSDQHLAVRFDGDIIIWNLQTGERVTTLPNEKETKFISAAFGANDEHVSTSQGIWRLADNLLTDVKPLVNEGLAEGAYYLGTLGDLVIVGTAQCAAVLDIRDRALTHLDNCTPDNQRLNIGYLPKGTLGARRPDEIAFITDTGVSMQPLGARKARVFVPFASGGIVSLQAYPAALAVVERRAVSVVDPDNGEVRFEVWNGGLAEMISTSDSRWAVYTSGSALSVADLETGAYVGTTRIAAPNRRRAAGVPSDRLVWLRALDESRVVVVATNHAHVYDLGGDGRPQLVHSLAGTGKEYSAVAVSMNKKLVALTQVEGGSQVWNVATGEVQSDPALYGDLEPLDAGVIQTTGGSVVAWWEDGRRTSLAMGLDEATHVVWTDDGSIVNQVGVDQVGNGRMLVARVLNNDVAVPLGEPFPDEVEIIDGAPVPPSPRGCACRLNVRASQTTPAAPWILVLVVVAGLLRRLCRPRHVTDSEATRPTAR